MNISFNGLKHITGTPEKIIDHLKKDNINYGLTPMVINNDGNQTEVYILTKEDGDNFIKQHIDLGAEVPKGSANESYKAGTELGNKVLALLRNKELIMKFFNEQKANGTEVEEIKL